MQTRALAIAIACSLVAAHLAPASAATVDVTVTNIVFNPSTVTIQVGDTVRWTNTAGFHNVNADGGTFRCANGCDGEGGDGDPASAPWVAQHTFNAPGTFPYHCQIHGAPGGFGMSGTVVVGGGGVPGSLAWSAPTYSVNEAGGGVTLTALRTGGDDGEVSASYSTANGTATAGSDYAARSGTLTWLDNDDNPRQVTVPITNDAAMESNEVFSVALSAPTGGATLGSPSTATVTIVDNDSGGGPGTLAFSAAAFEAEETAGSATITVQRTGGTGGAVSVAYATSGGTAVAGGDYTAASGTLSWGTGDGAPKTFGVPLTDDSDLEGDESVNLALSSPGGGAALGSPATAVLTIHDDETPPAGPCVADATTLCFLGNRFRITMDWRFAGGQTGQGQAVALSPTAGTFSFLNPDNREVLIKMLDACSLNSRFWVFYAATTNVELTITVVDTQSSAVKTYFNPLGTPAPPVQDTGAFATCP